MFLVTRLLGVALNNWCIYVTLCPEKCHFVVDYNSRISCSIVILFEPLVTGMNTLLHDHVRFTYLMAWWRHNCETSQVMKIYFITAAVKENVPRYFRLLQLWYLLTDFDNLCTILNRSEYSTKQVQTVSLQPNCVFTLGYLVKLKTAQKWQKQPTA